MAKMFYSLEEAAQKLGISEDQVKEMAAEGRLQQFRDRDKLMFKREQVDQLTSEGTDEFGDLSSTLEGFVEEEDQIIPLADDEEPISKPSALDSASDTDVIDLITSDTDDMVPSEESHPESDDTHYVDSEHYATSASSDSTQITDYATDPSSDTTQIADVPTDLDELPIEQIGSGSGLLDLTREIDDTGLGEELLDELYAPITTPEPSSESSSQAYDEPPVTAHEDQADVQQDAAYTQTDSQDAFDSSGAMESPITSSGIFDTGVELDFSTSGLENLQDIGEPSSVVPSMVVPTGGQPQPMDYPWNGLTIGAFAVATACLFYTLVVLIHALGRVPSPLPQWMIGSPLGVAAGGVVAIGVLGGVGFLLGQRAKGMLGSKQ